MKIDVGHNWFHNNHEVAVIMRNYDVVVFCNHLKTQTEKITHSYWNYYKEDTVDWSENIEFCQMCGAYRHFGEETWEMPE